MVPVGARSRPRKWRQSEEQRQLRSVTPGDLVLRDRDELMWTITFSDARADPCQFCFAHTGLCSGVNTFDSAGASRDIERLGIRTCTSLA